MSNLTEEDALKDLMNRHWTKLERAPREILLGTSVVAWDENRAIITGGLDANFQAEDSVFVYNQETMETEALPSMREERARHAAVIVGSNLFVIGGLGPGGIFLNSIEVLHLNDPREWKHYPVNLEIARYDFAAVVVNEHEIYIIGGANTDGRTRQILNSVEILNTATNTISQGPPMLEKRCGFAAALIGDLIVVTGGWTGQGVTGTCEQLSIRASTDEDDRRWQPLNSNMTTERSNHRGLAFGDCMVVVGGFNMASSNLRTTEVWNDTTGTWTPHPAILPTGDDLVVGFVKLGEDLVCFVGGNDPKVYCLFCAKGLLEHQRLQIRFNELIADELPEIVIPLLLEGLGQRGWTSLFYECIRETNGRLIPRRSKQSALGKRSRGGA